MKKKPTRIMTKEGEILETKKELAMQEFLGKRWTSYTKPKKVKIEKIMPNNNRITGENEIESKKRRYIKQRLSEFISPMKKNNKKIIACVLRKSDDYDVDYVNHLIADLQKNVKTDVEYVCISDVDVSHICKWLHFEHNWPGWWSKLELFSHPYLRGQDVIYFDLDVIIRSDITDVIEYNHDFSMLQGFSQSGGVNSSIMAWSGDRSYITKSFNPRLHMKRYRKPNKWGDQDFIRDNVKQKITFFQQLFPGYISSRKLEKNKDVVKNSKVVCFHGKPRPRETGWKI